MHVSTHTSSRACTSKHYRSSMSEIAIWEQINGTGWGKRGCLSRLKGQDCFRRSCPMTVHEWQRRTGDMIFPVHSWEFLCHLLVISQSFLSHLSLNVEKFSKTAYCIIYHSHLSTGNIIHSNSWTINIICSHSHISSTVFTTACTCI